MSDRVNGFAERLRKLRLEMDITQSEMAKMGGVSRATISLYESGERIPNIAFLQAVVRKTGCGYDYLLGEETIDSDLSKRLNQNYVSFETMTARVYMEQALEVLKKLESGE